ncbi:MAG: hypothetical protein J6C95_01920 [Muribaculaceae bacterium]|nr:hypothetical protein [Muribaculaceae bacterium]
MDILIVIGLLINVVGAVALMIYSIRYYHAFKQAGRLSVRMEYLKSQWAKKRTIGFGLMIGGLIVAIIGCVV